MVSDNASSMVFLRLLADRQKRLAALLWSAQPGTPASLKDWFSEPDLAALSQDISCLWLSSDCTTWPADTQDMLVRSGMRPVTANQLSVCSDRFSLPSDANWCLGTWYLQAPPQAGKAQTTSRSQTLQLLQLVNNDADTRDLEDVFRRDATLSYQLLRLVNSPAMRRSREITSFGQAILLLGRQQLKRWINLLLFAARDDDERSALLLAHVCLRARGMELLAQAAGLDRAMQEQAFMTGMFSLLGVLFGSPLPPLLQPLLLGEDMSAALLRGEGELGALLHTWQAVESANAPALQTYLATRGIDVQEYNRLLVQASQWMLGLTRGGVAA